MSITSTEYFCDQCGARYADPGVCTNQHPANTLKPVAGDVATTDVEPAGFGNTGTGIFGTVRSSSYTGADRRVLAVRRAGPTDLRVSAGVSPTGTERRIAAGARRTAIADRRTLAAVIPGPSGPGVLEPPVTPATTGAGAVTTTPTGTTTATADGGTIPVAVDAAPIVADVSQAIRDAFAELEAAAIRLKGLL